MAKAIKRKQLNIRLKDDDDLPRQIGELQRLDDSGPTVPSQADIVRKAVAETLERWRSRGARKR